MGKFFRWNFERGKMSAEEEMKQARKWLCENAAAVAKWAVQTTEDLTLSGSFYTKEQLYAALEDSLPLLSAGRTDMPDLSNLPEGPVARRMIVAHTADAVMKNSVSREFDTPQGTQTRYTTDELLRAEQTIFTQAAEMAAKPADGQPYADLNDIRQTVALMAGVIDIGANHAFDMPPEYLKVFDDFLKPANLRIANGPPGSGKSTLAQGLLFALTKDAVENGRAVPDFYAAAPSEKAAADIVGDMNMMKEFCIRGGAEKIGDNMPKVQGAPSLDDMIGLLRSGRVKPGSVLVIDEAGLMGARQTAALLTAANKSGIRLFMMGDNLQIPPKTAGNGFDQLLQNKDSLGLDVCELDVVLRQKTAGEARWTTDIREENALRALKGYAGRRYTGYVLSESGQVNVSYTDGGDKGEPGLQMQEDKNAVYARLTQDFIRYRRECPAGSYVVMGTDEASARDLNLYMRREMIAGGLITGVKNYGTADKPFEVGRGDTLILDKPVKMTGAERAVSVEVQAGTQLVVAGEKDGGLIVRCGDQNFDCAPRILAENARYGLALPLYQAQGQSKDRAFLAVDKTGCMDKVYGGVAFSRHVRQMSAYVSKQAYPAVEALAEEMAVFRTRQPLISDRVGCEILKEQPKRTQENVAAALKQGVLLKSRLKDFR